VGARASGAGEGGGAVSRGLHWGAKGDVGARAVPRGGGRPGLAGGGDPTGAGGRGGGGCRYGLAAAVDLGAGPVWPGLGAGRGGVAGVRGGRGPGVGGGRIVVSCVRDAGVYRRRAGGWWM